MRPNTTVRQEASMGKVLSYVTQNLSEPCTLQQLSRVACFAPFHFHRIFREATGVPVHGFVRRLRLERAIYALLFSRQSIIQIALRVGYQSHEAFTRAFQDAYGTTPSRFRSAFAGRSAPAEGCSAAECIAQGVDVSPSSRAGGWVAFRSWFGSYTGVRAWWRDLAERLAAAGLCPEACPAVGVVYDDPCSTRSIRYDTCVLVPQDFAGGHGLGFQMLPRADTAVLSHRGPSALTVQAFIRASSAWAVRVPERPLRRVPYYEEYRHFPFADGREEVEVDVHVPLAG